MEAFLEPLGATMVILQESIKILPKNRNLLALTVLPTLFLTSLFYLIFNFSYKSLLRDMFMRESFLPFTTSESAEFTSVLAKLKHEAGLMFLLDLSFLFAYWIISLFFVTASILLSAISHGDGTLSCWDFALMVVRICTRPLITGFFTTLLDFGYIFFVLAMAAPIFMFSDFRLGYVPSSIIWYAIFAYFLYVYLSITWILSIVVSVVEENCCGIEALGKAGGLVKGKRAQGVILNVCFVVLNVVIFQGYRIIRGHKWLVNDTVFGFFVVNFSCLVKLFQFVAYTVLYFHCKKHHGEEIELQGGVAEFYSKIATPPFAYDEMT